MYKASWLVTFSEGLDDDARRDAAARLGVLVEGLPGRIHARSRPSLDGAVNGGDIVSHVVFANEAAWREARSSEAWMALDAFCSSSAVARCDWAVYRRERAGDRDPAISGGVHRILFLAIMPAVPADKVAQFEREMARMPDYLPAIRNWNLSRVLESGVERAWSHVWEQDFAGPQDLFGPYMMHPIHFAHIDRWFDPQSHDWIVDPELCSTYCRFETSALALDQERLA